jgi:Na+-translocating ferredoxin:NAD+ oxidoreductase RnfD subunit
MKMPLLYQYMIFSVSILVLFNVYQDVFTLRVIEAVLMSILTAVLLDGLMIMRKEGKFRFSGGALISGLIIAALIEPDLENKFIYFVSPTLAILSKHLIRAYGRNVFNPAAFGLLATSLLFHGVITWWAATPFYLVFPFGLFIVYKMKGWHLVLSFLLTAAPLYIIYGISHQIGFIDSIGLINGFFVLFMLTEHKAAPLAARAKVIYGSFIGFLSFAVHFYYPQIDNTILALLIGNLASPSINKWATKGQPRPATGSVN